MIIRSLMVMLSIIGFFFWFMGKASAFMSMLGLDYIGVFMMFVPVIICLIQLSRTRTSIQFDPPSGPGQAIINFIRRDSNIIPLVGNRVYAGESFLDVPRLGLIEDLGKDTVFNWGVRRTRLGLENINYTPDPRYFNLTAELYHLGIDNSDDLWNILNVSSIRDKEMKAYYLEYMGRIYQNILHPSSHGAVRLVEEIKTHKVKRIRFNPNARKEYRFRKNRSEDTNKIVDRPIPKPVSTFVNPPTFIPKTSVDDDVDRLIRQGGR